MPNLKYVTLFILLIACSLPAMAEVGVKGAIEGVHYDLIQPAQPTSAPEGQVEITELFWYGCPHCFRFEPYIKGWLKNKSDKIIFRRVALVGHGGNHRAVLFNTKYGFELGGVCPGSNHAGRRPASQQQVNRLDDNRFTGPGLATQHGQAVVKPDSKIIDDGKVADGKLLEHLFTE